VSVHEVAARLEPGGYEIVHNSPGLEVGVYVLEAPHPDTQEPHPDDELYVVLEGEGVLEVAGERRDARPGTTLFVAAGVEHRFSDYERLVALVIFTRPT
jgi:mannose-6-phosphate isomerase-like protein (cupin superfamily)